MEGYQFFWVCAECDEPVQTLNMCEYLGHNPGVSGHVFLAIDVAMRRWSLFLEHVLLYGSAKGSYWKGTPPFASREEEVKYLKDRIRLFKVELHPVVTESA